MPTGSLRSNSGDDRVEFTVADFTEDVVLVDVRIEARSVYRDHEMESCDDRLVAIDIPSIHCSRLCWREFLSRMDNFASLPISKLAAADVTYAADLSVAEYHLGDRFRIEVTKPEVHRSVGDQRRLRVWWKKWSTEVSFSLTFDVTSAATFVREIK